MTFPKERYFRKVIARPEGGVEHYGDCDIHALSGICTCGLLKDLEPLGEEALAIYPDFDEHYSKHMKNLRKLEAIRLGVYIPEENQDAVP